MATENKIVGGVAISINGATSIVGGYEVPVDPMEDQQCESCQ